MAEKQQIRTARTGTPMDDEALAMHLKAFSDMNECFEYLDKQQLSLLTKSKKRATIKSTSKSKEKPVCENSTSIKKKPLKRPKT